jgi:hypothetical protein
MILIQVGPQICGKCLIKHRNLRASSEWVYWPDAITFPSFISQSHIIVMEDWIKDILRKTRLAIHEPRILTRPSIDLGIHPVRDLWAQNLRVVTKGLLKASAGWVQKCPMYIESESLQLPDLSNGKLDQMSSVAVDQKVGPPQGERVWSCETE